MTNIEKWIVETPLREVAHKLIPDDCNKCPCQEECKRTNWDICEEFFMGWALSEVENEKTL